MIKHYLTGQVSKLRILSEGIRTEHREGDTEYRKGRTINNEKFKGFIETDEMKKMSENRTQAYQKMTDPMLIYIEF